MQYKVIESNKTGDSKQYGNIAVKQYDDSITVEVIMENNHLYPSDILPVITFEDTTTNADIIDTELIDWEIEDSKERSKL